MHRILFAHRGKPRISLVGSMVAGDIFHDTCVGNCVFVTWIWISIILMTLAFYTCTCLIPPRSLAKLYIIFHQPIDFPERREFLFLSYLLGKSVVWGRYDSGRLVHVFWKINMEPTNHPFRKENALNQTSRELRSMLIFRGAIGNPYNGCHINPYRIGLMMSLSPIMTWKYFLCVI